MIKPEFFDDPDVADLSMTARMFFIGLWTQADKEGRLVDDVRRLKARIFPFDDVDVEALAVELHGKDMIRRYVAGDKHGYIWIKNFTKHQRPHPKEPASVIPPYVDGNVGKRGKPRKNTASNVKDIPNPSESGVLILDSGVRNLDVSLEPLRVPSSPEPSNGSGPPVRASPTMLEFPVVGADGPIWALTEAQLEAWAGLFPALDVRQEARHALAWVRAQTGRRKTARGMPKFLVGWLTRSVDRGTSHTGGRVVAAPQPDDRGHLPPCRTMTECRDRALREAAAARMDLL